MTREELCGILELFATCVIQTSISGLDADTQHDLIVTNIETVADSVMVASKRDALRYSVN